ncbi:putative nodal modulator 1 [Apostichopus japonicus]|uniref:Putative nodal modulator 1 n=1 Tax=Stichopus japonicus TaxID=307972 RepID=A0A2G8JEK3_STIJA|nr:putative nodal modulator 1 [Apostichopus japonicus]
MSCSSAATVKITPNTPRLPDILAIKFSVCGKVEVDAKSGVSLGKRRVLLNPTKQGNAEAVSTSTDSHGKFCFQVKPGEYVLTPIVTDAETKKGLKIIPDSQSLTVTTSPILDITFTQFKAKVGGSVTCIGICGKMEVLLVPVDPAIGEAKTVKVNQDSKKATFQLQNVLPGKYHANIVRDKWCWDKESIDVVVTDKDVTGVAFTQTGFQMLCETTHPQPCIIILSPSSFLSFFFSFCFQKYKHQKSSKDGTEVDLKMGTKSICLAKPGVYKLTVESCHQFEKDQYTFDTTQILKEDAYSRKHADVIFKKCSDSVHHYRAKKEEVSKFVDEAIKLREERRKLAEVPPLPVLKFQSSFKDFRWKHLGDQLIQLYDYVDSAEPPIVPPAWQWKRQLPPLLLRVDLGRFCSPFARVETDGDTVAWTEQSDGGVSGMETDELSERQTDGEGVAVSNANQGGIIGSSDSQIQTTDVSGTETEEAPEKSRKSHKKKRGLMSEPAPGKRRSARVRNTEKKKEVRESINYQELLLRFLPSTLLQSNQEEPVDIFESPSAQPQRQSANTKDLPDLPVTSDLAGAKPKPPRKLYSVYVEVYKRMRKHITIPALFFKDQTDGYKRNLGLVILVYMEISVDRGRISKAQEKRFGDFFQQDMFYLEDLGVMESIMKEYLPDFAVRVYWMRAHNFAGEGKTAEAVHAYEVCHELLTTSDLNEKIIHLPNIIQDKIITKEIIESKKDSLRRTQSHEEILKLFKGGNYEKVVDILRPVVDTPRSDGMTLKS